MAQKFELNANEKAGAKVLKVFAWLIVIAVTVYSEIMFLGIVSVIFPDGVLRVGAIMGAIATGASVLVLYAGKSKWFRPGTQLITAWVFTGIEVSIMVMNDVLAFAMHNGNVDGYLAMWKSITPASPVVALVGWGLIMFLDPSRRIAHLQMEMEDHIQEAAIKFQLAQHAAQMNLQYKYLTQHTMYLEQGIESPGALKAIEDGARDLTAKSLTGLTGLPVTRAQLNGQRSVEADKSPN